MRKPAALSTQHSALGRAGGALPRIACALAFAAGALWLPLRVRAAGGASGDWPMWGGSPERNMVSAMKGLPTSWDVATGKNVKWVAALGSQTYGNPVVSGGMVFVGTNNEGLRDPKQPGDRGVVMAFRESDGELLWQMTHEKLAAGRVNDWPYQGIASSPLVEGDRVYYVSNRCELMCLDTQGFRDGENDGPYTEEKLRGPLNADIVWRFDMIEEVGAFPHNLANSSPLSFGDLVYVSTSNGQDESHVHIPSPRAPAIIAVNKKTGKLVWEDNSVGERILHIDLRLFYKHRGLERAAEGHSAATFDRRGRVARRDRGGRRHHPGNGTPLRRGGRERPRRRHGDL